MKTNAAEFGRELALLAAGLRAQIEAECEAFAADPAASRERRAVAEHDLRFFAETYFPHYCRAAFGQVHDYLFARLQAISAGRGTRDAIAAPRGEAKTTLAGVVCIVWLVLYAKRHFAIIGMDAFEQAAETLTAVKTELEANPRLRMDFPDESGQGRVWRENVILTRNDVKVEAVGAGKRIRGRRHGPHRPDFFLLDDIENDENVGQKPWRDKREKWVLRTVIPLGGADDSLTVLLIGTVLHIDSVLARFLANPLWTARRFKAIPRMPDRMDLWDRWEEVLRNTPGTPEEKEAAAHAFYARHRAAMDAGALVSWPAMRPLEKLMLRRARDGHAAFDAELQNDPGAETRFFVGLQFWVDRRADWIFFGACDPSLGKRGQVGGDPSAILVGGYNRETSRCLDVVHAAIARRLPLRIIAEIIECQREWRCVAWGFESVQFQEFMRQQLIDASIEAECPVPARALTPIADKALRIESLQPFVERGLIRAHPSQQALIDELRHYPHGEHVDGLDALQMLWVIAVSGGIAAGATVEDAVARTVRRQAVRMFARSGGLRLGGAGARR